MTQNFSNDSYFTVTDPVARQMLLNLRASIEADRVARRRYEQSWRGRLTARGWWPRDAYDWTWVAVVVWGIVGTVLFAYAGYLEASAPPQGP